MKIKKKKKVIITRNSQRQTTDAYIHIIIYEVMKYKLSRQLKTILLINKQRFLDRFFDDCSIICAYTYYNIIDRVIESRRTTSYLISKYTGPIFVLE